MRQSNNRKTPDNFLAVGLFSACVGVYSSNMAVEKQKLEEILRRLPQELQDEVLAFAEALLARRSSANSDTKDASVSSFFGACDSGDPRSADNDRIDSDLAREYANSHKTE